MPILIPPAVLDEVPAVLHLPMAPHPLHQRLGPDFVGGSARQPVTRLQGDLLATLPDLVIQPEDQLHSREIARLTHIVRRPGLVDPKLACLDLRPLFSTVLASGAVAAASAKQSVTASRTS